MKANEARGVNPVTNGAIQLAVSLPPTSTPSTTMDRAQHVPRKAQVDLNLRCGFPIRQIVVNYRTQTECQVGKDMDS